MSTMISGHRWIPMLAAVAPLAVFMCIRFVSTGGPSAAPAAVVPAPPVEPLGGSAAASPVQRRAHEWLNQWSLPTALASPMLHETPEPIESLPEPEAPSPAPPAPVPDFAVKTIMGSGERGMTTINGKAFRLGGEPAPGWRITRIDGNAKIVVVTGPDGQSLELVQGDRKH